MSLMIEKLDGGYVVTHTNTRQVVTAEHVANLITKFWPDVLAHIRANLANSEVAADDAPESINNT